MSSPAGKRATAAEALQTLRDAAFDALAAGELPAFLGEVERLRVEILVSAVTSAPQVPADPPAAGNDEPLLSVVEVARRLGVSKWWVYENKDVLPIVRFPSGRYGFSEKRLERWIERRVTS